MTSSYKSILTMVIEAMRHHQGPVSEYSKWYSARSCRLPSIMFLACENSSIKTSSVVHFKLLLVEIMIQGIFFHLPNISYMYIAHWICAWVTQFVLYWLCTFCQHGTHLGPVGPRWAPCWFHDPCYQGYFRIASVELKTIVNITG